MSDIDRENVNILKAIAELRVSYPNANKIVAQVADINPSEIGSRLEDLEKNGFVKVLKGTYSPDVSLPNGIYAAGLTERGRLTVIKNR